MNRYGIAHNRYVRKAPAGGKGNGSRWPTGNAGPDPNDLIDAIVDAIDYAEVARDSQGLIKARRLLNNDLRQAIDVYIQDEVTRELQKRRGNPALPQEGEGYASHPG